MNIRNAFLILGMMAALSPAAMPTRAETAHPTPSAASAPTAVPALVPYSGAAIAGDGKPLAGETGITFLIFKEETGGEPLWAETQTVALDAAGRYKVQLGATSQNGLPSDLFSSGEARWLEVQVAGETPQARVLLASVPYALKAGDATTLGGLPVSAFALAGTKLASPAAAAVDGVHPDTVSNVTTTGGTSGYVPLFTGASTVVDSEIYDAGTGIGIGRQPNAAAKLDVNGETILRGNTQLSRAGTATAGGGFDSFPFAFYASSYSSTANTAENPNFAFQAEPTGNNTPTPSATLNLVFSSGGAPAETGFLINPNGIVKFAPGQTFPGTGSGTITGVAAGTALTGGGASGNVTLNLDTSKVPLLSANNSFAGNQTVSGSITGGASLFLPNTSSATVGLVQLGTTPFLSNYGPSGTRNVFVGGAGNFAASGNINTGVGSDALLFETTGSLNTGVGAFALEQNKTGTGNTALGYDAGPDSASTALSNATAVGYDATVSQSNTLVLGQTTAGNPGASHVSVGVGTAKPISTMELAVINSGAIGPALTLTNPGGNAQSSLGAVAIDFNTQAVLTTGTYNPGARIEVIDDGLHTSDINFLSNKYGGGSGSGNGGLQTNMTISGLGAVSIGINEASAQLEVLGNQTEGVWALGGGQPDEGMTQGEGGLRAIGGFSTGTDSGGTGAWIIGGDSDAGESGTGLLVWPGGPTTGSTGLAGDFEGNVYINGTLSANAKDFKIDHPLDPANKYLVHTSVESSEMMNIYTGNVTTDELGLATVALPSWFEAENTDFRYQLTVVDERFAQAVVSKRMQNNQFTIHTNASQVQVSWQVTAIRQDAYAKAHPLVVEETKADNERGFYQHPELYGQPKEKQTRYGIRPEMARQVVEEKRKMKLGLLRPAQRPNKASETSPAASAGLGNLAEAATSATPKP